ncbi:ModD protein [Adlercreutzia sp. ZJ138]|uniref:ModD protein n=1 Tax=Adlercreutzia sp. ZJ138 TaxID=2709405 RepID=UPI0013EB23B7|nr:ModD protein [Adlercreutzia sp. ZJ138]
MIRIPTERIDRFIEEDIPYIDLTSMVLGIGDCSGRMEYFTREDCVLAGASVVRQIMERIGCRVVEGHDDGAKLKSGEVFLVAEGSAANLHAAWKVCLNVFDHLSAIATMTRKMVDAAHRANPHCEILTTRKSMPGVKDLMTEAVMIGGAYPHRLGLSETVLVFEQHLAFLGGFDAFIERMPEFRARCIEKKLFVESGVEHALDLAKAGVDGIQLDKIPAVELKDVVEQIRAVNSHITLIAAGGIGLKNAEEYAGTGVDGLATTAPFAAKPMDMSVRIVPSL